MSERKTILIVDDVPEILEVLVRLAEGYDARELAIVATSDPREAIRLLAERRFDLVISDLRMPSVDGLTVLKAAREGNPSGRRILMTGYNEIPAATEDLLAAQTWAQLSKPLDGATFVQAIAAALADADEDPIALAQRRYDEAALRLWRLQTAKGAADRAARLAAVESVRETAAALRQARAAARATRNGPRDSVGEL